MKTNRLSLIIFFLFIFSSLYAQPPHGGKGEKKEMIRSLRVGIYTEVLNLTAKEAQVFWPLFNEYQDKVDEIRESINQEKRAIMKSYSTMSDKDTKKVLERIFGYKQKELDLKIQYTNKFMEVIPIKKVVLMQKAERKFHQILLDKVRKNKPGPHNR